MSYCIRKFALAFTLSWVLVAGALLIINEGDGALALPSLYVVPVYIKFERGFDSPITPLFLILCLGSVCLQVLLGWFLERGAVRLLGEPSFIRRALWQLVILIAQILIIICAVRILSQSEGIKLCNLSFNRW